MRKIILSDEIGEELDVPKEEHLFNVSDVLSRETQKIIQRILSLNIPTGEQVQKILQIKARGLETILKIDEHNLLRNCFSIDGGITLTQEDLEEISRNLYLVGDKSPQPMSDSIDNPYIYTLYEDFCHVRGNKLHFRNAKYHFLFESVEIKSDDIQINTSINDYQVTDVDMEKFPSDIYTQYNRVNQHLKLFFDFFCGMTAANIIENIDNFYKEIYELFDYKKLKTLKKQIKNSEISPNKAFNQEMKQQYFAMIKFIETFKTKVGHLWYNSKIPQNPHRYQQAIELLAFMSENHEGISQIKNVFGLDIDKILRKYVYAEVGEGLKKLMLGLLDAKINLLGFMQNMTQILYNKHFFTPEFEGDLILRRNQMQYIQQIAPEVITDFKTLQAKISSQYENNQDIALELNETIGYFCDILIGDKPESYIYATAHIPQNLPEIHTGNTSEEVEIFHPTFTVFQKLLESIEKFGSTLDIIKKQKHQAGVLKHQKKAAKGSTSEELPAFETGKNPHYLQAKADVFKKIIRLHREENHPLIMIKTAQNAYMKLVAEGYRFTDNLHILSVNYGGALVGYFAKHIFEKMQGNGRILTNVGNIVYSIYDIKNANDFLGIVDYPFNEYIQTYNSGEMQDYFRQGNHLVIFDDNTTTGRTLSDLQKLAMEMGCFGKVDIFACKANEQHKFYDKNISPSTVVNFIAYSSTQTRKTKIGPIKRGYKELIGTYIGNSLYKSHIKDRFKK